MCFYYLIKVGIVLQLSHIGEILLSSLIAKSADVKKMLFDDAVIQNDSIKVIPEIRLDACGSLIFDGVHKIDVSVLDLNKGICYPIEAKLGLDRLSKNEFEKRFIADCGTSHQAARVKGSMVSILERRLPVQCKGHDLTVTYNGQKFIVSDNWSLVCRQPVINKWSLTGKPALSEKCSITSFESLVRAYGSNNDFNNLMKRLLEKDYYAEWLTK